MPTNVGDALLGVLRTRLVTVPDLPYTAWSNTPYTPDPTVAFVEDGIRTVDTQPRECGPDAWDRTDATYRVRVRVPFGEDAQRALAWAVAIRDACRDTPMTVLDQDLWLLDTRVTTSQTDLWFLADVTLVLQFDHP